MLPIKTTINDFDVLGGYLKTQVGWVAVDKVKATIDAKHADTRKLEAGKFIGFLERDGLNVRLTDVGRQYSTSDDEATKQAAMLKMLNSVELYANTVHWMHFSSKVEPTRTEVGNYWHDRQADKLEGAKNAALTDAVIFFLRLAGAAGLGKFINAGGGRPESYLRGDAAAIEAAATTGAQPTAPAAGSEAAGGGNDTPQVSTVTAPAPAPAVPTVSVSTSPSIHVNIEIHIAADATPSTVEEIFRNMRKYVLSAPVEDAK